MAGAASDHSVSQHSDTRQQQTDNKIKHNNIMPVRETRSSSRTSSTNSKNMEKNWMRGNNDIDR